MGRNRIYRFEIEEAEKLARKQAKEEVLWAVLDFASFLVACGGVVFFLFVLFS